MSAPADVLSGSQRPASPVVAIPFARRLYWLVRRELWEFRSLYIGPFAAAVLTVIGGFFAAVKLPGKLHAAAALSAADQIRIVQDPYNFAALLLMLATFLLSVVYCLEALYSERRDRSILFWKSQPVSDTLTVLSKAFIPLIFLPLYTFVLTVAVQIAMVLMSVVSLTLSGVGTSLLWAGLPLLNMWTGILFHLITVHSLWYAPFFGWFLFISAYARRVPLLWATLPVLALALIERMAFGTSNFLMFVLRRFGGNDSDPPYPANTMTHGPMGSGTVGHLMHPDILFSPGLWTGLAVTAIFLTLAIRLRRVREPH
ncbi:MAG TPA: hypothetical protein VMT51_04395 [Dongiaceae bacterium]|nr:hypothetical protein [Dongiaceae bacterium]